MTWPGVVAAPRIRRCVREKSSVSGRPRPAAALGRRAIRPRSAITHRDRQHRGVERQPRTRRPELRRRTRRADSRLSGLSPMMGLTHGVHGIGDTIAISVHAAESAIVDVDAYVARLAAALRRLLRRGGCRASTVGGRRFNTWPVLLHDCLRRRASDPAGGAGADDGRARLQQVLRRWPDRTAGWFESIGMKPGMFHAWSPPPPRWLPVGLVVGLLTPIPAAGFVSLMLVAAWRCTGPSASSSSRKAGNTTWCSATAAVAVATLGAGKLSLDYACSATAVSTTCCTVGGAGHLARARPRRRHRPVGRPGAGGSSAE